VHSASHCSSYRTIERHVGLCWGADRPQRRSREGPHGRRPLAKAGEVQQYTHVVEQARHHALQGLVEHARVQGANAVIGVRFDPSDRAVDRALRQPGLLLALRFEYALPLGITIELPDWAPPEAAQVLRLSRYDAGVRGEVEYPPASNTAAE